MLYTALDINSIHIYTVLQKGICVANIGGSHYNYFLSTLAK